MEEQKLRAQGEIAESEFLILQQQLRMNPFQEEWAKTCRQVMEQSIAMKKNKNFVEFVNDDGIIQILKNIIQKLEKGKKRNQMENLTLITVAALMPYLERRYLSILRVRNVIREGKRASDRVVLIQSMEELPEDQKRMLISAFICGFRHGYIYYEVAQIREDLKLMKFLLESAPECEYLICDCLLQFFDYCPLDEVHMEIALRLFEMALPRDNKEYKDQCVLRATYLFCERKEAKNKPRDQDKKDNSPELLAVALTSSLFGLDWIDPFFKMLKTYIRLLNKHWTSQAKDHKHVKLRDQAYSEVLIHIRDKARSIYMEGWREHLSSLLTIKPPKTRTMLLESIEDYGTKHKCYFLILGDLLIQETNYYSILKVFHRIRQAFEEQNPKPDDLISIIQRFVQKVTVDTRRSIRKSLYIFIAECLDRLCGKVINEEENKTVQMLSLKFLSHCLKKKQSELNGVEAIQILASIEIITVRYKEKFNASPKKLAMKFLQKNMRLLIFPDTQVQFQKVLSQVCFQNSDFENNVQLILVFFPISNLAFFRLFILTQEKDDRHNPQYIDFVETLLKTLNKAVDGALTLPSEECERVCHELSLLREMVTASKEFGSVIMQAIEGYLMHLLDIFPREFTITRQLLKFFDHFKLDEEDQDFGSPQLKLKLFDTFQKFYRNEEARLRLPKDFQLLQTLTKATLVTTPQLGLIREVNGFVEDRLQFLTSGEARVEVFVLHHLLYLACGLLETCHFMFSASRLPESREAAEITASAQDSLYLISQEKLLSLTGSFCYETLFKIVKMFIINRKPRSSMVRPLAKLSTLYLDQREVMTIPLGTRMLELFIVVLVQSKKEPEALFQAAMDWIYNLENSIPKMRAVPRSADLQAEAEDSMLAYLHSIKGSPRSPLFWKLAIQIRYQGLAGDIDYMVAGSHQVAKNLRFVSEVLLSGKLREKKSVKGLQRDVKKFIKSQFLNVVGVELARRINLMDLVSQIIAEMSKLFHDRSHEGTPLALLTLPSFAVVELLAKIVSKALKLATIGQHRNVLKKLSKLITKVCSTTIHLNDVMPEFLLLLAKRLFDDKLTSSFFKKARETIRKYKCHMPRWVLAMGNDKVQDEDELPPEPVEQPTFHLEEDYNWED